MFSGLKNFILSNTRNKWTVDAIGCVCVCVAVVGERGGVGVGELLAVKAGYADFRLESHGIFISRILGKFLVSI